MLFLCLRVSPIRGTGPRVTVHSPTQGEFPRKTGPILYHSETIMLLVKEESLYENKRGEPEVVDA